MAVEDDEPKDREVWNHVARFWYNKASDKNPSVGRLNHHLAILARPYTLEQLSLYARSLTCVNAFDSARGSIMTLFGPVLSSGEKGQHRPSSFETSFIRIHAKLFTIKLSEPMEPLENAIFELLRDRLFETYILKAGARFKDIGVYIAVANIAALFEYGSSNNGLSKSRLRMAYERALSVKQDVVDKSHPTSAMTNKKSDPASLPPSTGPPDGSVDVSLISELNEVTPFISQPSRLTSIVLSVCLKDPRNSNMYPLIHYYLVYLWSLVLVQQACKYLDQNMVMQTIERDIPWAGLCLLFNTIASEPRTMTAKVRRPGFPKSARELGRPLPEDFILRGQIYAQWYFPSNWFAAAMNDDDERSLDLPSMIHSRKERILWLAFRIASVCLHAKNQKNHLITWQAQQWISFDKVNAHFVVMEPMKQSVTQEPVPPKQDQDTAMSETETLDGRSTTLSLVGDSLGSSGASSPTTTIAPAQNSPSACLGPNAMTDDVSMRDVSLGENLTATTP